MTILGLCEWLEGTALAALIQESLYGFPALVAIHILGLSLSVGTLAWVDLRMLGISMTGMRVSAVYRRLAPWFLVGFATMFISGAALFTAFATSAYGNLYFRIKLLGLLLAGINALAFHRALRASASWDAAARPPAAVRIAGLISIALWATVIVCGRMMSYTMFSFP